MEFIAQKGKFGHRSGKALGTTDKQQNLNIKESQIQRAIRANL